MIQIILIGGPTLIGKSEFIDCVIAKGDKFSRPHSYTTRPRRHNEPDGEYEHVSIDEFQQLESNGLFVTVDEVYGQYYAIAYNSIDRIVRGEKIAIKEVHPKNHAKLKGLLSGVISVLLLPKDMNRFWIELEQNLGALPADRVARMKDDREFYRTINPFLYPFDIVMMVDAFSTPDSLSDEFFRYLSIITKESTEYVKAIERKNKSSYDFIADEFTDDRRITTANFHDISLSFFGSRIKQYMSCNQCVLDVGTGRGYLIPVIRKATTKVIAMDLSVRMLSFINPWPSGAMRVCASAFDLPFASNSFNLVTSSLADPFLREEALNEILRILVDGGFFIFSSPSKIWSDAIRKTDDDTRIITRFVNSAGLEATVYSFTANYEMQFR